MNLGNLLSEKKLKYMNYTINVYQDSAGNNYFIMTNKSSKIKQIWGPIPQNELNPQINPWGS